MNESDIERAAALLAEARRTHRAIILPDACRPRDLDAAYAIQERVTAALGLELAGFKIGATSPQVAAAEGASSPVSGRLFRDHVHTSPACLDASRFTRFRNCEVEFAVRLAHALPARPGGHPRVAVEAAIGEVLPAIEIGDSRLLDRATAGIATVCADNSGGTELVLGQPLAHWRELDLPRCAVSLLFNARPVAAGSGADVMGDPVTALVWLAHQRSALGEDLAAGTLVATGSCTGINIAQPGDLVVADFGPLGRVEISFGPLPGQTPASN